MGDLLAVVLYGVLPSMAAALLLVGWLGPRFTGLAAGVGLICAYGLLQRWPKWPLTLLDGNNDATQWLCWCVLALGALATLCGSRLFPRAVTWSGGIVCMLGQTWLMLTNMRRRWEGEEAVVQHGAAAAVFLGVWGAVRRTIEWRGSAATAALMAACLAGDAVVLLLGGSALQGQLAGAGAAAFGAAAGTSLWRTGFRLDRSTALPFAAAHCGLLLAGLHFSDLGLPAALMAAAAPAALVASGPPVSGAGGAGRMATGIGLLAVLLAAAVVLAAQAQP